MSLATDNTNHEQGLNVPVSSKRKPRGDFTVSELLKQIDPDEIEDLNASVNGFAEDQIGKEVW